MKSNARTWAIVIILLLAIGIVLAMTERGVGAGKEAKWAAVYCMDGSAYIGKISEIQYLDGEWVMVTLDADLTLWTHQSNLTLMSQKPEYLDDLKNDAYVGKER